MGKTIQRMQGNRLANPARIARDMLAQLEIGNAAGALDVLSLELERANEHHEHCRTAWPWEWGQPEVHLKGSRSCCRRPEL